MFLSVCIIFDKEIMGKLSVRPPHCTSVPVSMNLGEAPVELVLDHVKDLSGFRTSRLLPVRFLLNLYYCLNFFRAQLAARDSW